VPAHANQAPTRTFPFSASLRSLSEPSASALFLSVSQVSALQQVATSCPSLCRDFSARFVSFQQLTASFLQTRGVGGIMVNQHGPGASRTKQTGRMPDTLCARSSMLNHARHPHSQASCVPRHSVYLTAVRRGETMSPTGRVQRAVSPCRLTSRSHLRGGGHGFTNLN
jgi:hypothetical protein